MDTKKKTGFNLIDVFVILIIIALIAGTLYFSWRENKGPASQLKERNITYTVRLTGVDEDFISVFSEEGHLYNSSSLNYIGTIKKVTMEKTAVLTDKASSTVSGTDVSYTVIETKYDDLYDVYITITAKTTLDSRGVAHIDGERITIGSKIYIRAENFSHAAYITSFSIG